MAHVFLDYFKDTEEYPKFSGSEILPPDTLYEFISASFLNGFINYVKIEKAFVLGEYTKWDEVLDNTISIQEPVDSFKWVNKEGLTKQQAYDLLTEEGRVYHTQLCDLQDTIVILAKSHYRRSLDTTSMYWFFLYDPDCSDCCIGRFITEDPNEVVVSRFESYAKDYEGNKLGEKELPLHYFAGWISF